MISVAVVDYGGSNLRSVAKALEHVGGRDCRVEVTDSPAHIDRADRVVFPGQGAMGACMRNLRERDLDVAVIEAANSKPFLGICMGLQSLLETSEEDGGTQALGIIAGKVVRFPDPPVDPRSGSSLKIPHMGWNRVEAAQPHPLWHDIPTGTWFYFVHSYYVAPTDPSVVAGRSDYGVSFTAAIARGNVFATQFHPEKSQRAGLQLLANYLAWDGAA